MKLCVAIDSLPAVTNPGARKIIMFLPEWELHEIGLLTYYYIAKKHGVKVYYLGQNVPFNDLLSVAHTVEPDMLAVYFVAAISKEEIENYLKELVNNFPKQHILISGMQTNGIKSDLPDYIKLIGSANEFKQFIKTQQV